MRMCAYEDKCIKRKTTYLCGKLEVKEEANKMLNAK